MAEFRCSPEQLAEMSRNYANLKANVEDSLSSLKSLSSELLSVWEGDAANAYAETFEQLNSDFITSIEFLDGVSRTLGNASQVYADAEESIRSQY